MRNRFDRQLEELHVELIEMGSMCEDVIRKTKTLAVRGCKSGKGDPQGGQQY